MQLSVATEHLARITDIMEEYICQDVKDYGKEFSTVNAMCTFYTSLKAASAQANEANEKTLIDMPDAVKAPQGIPATIQRHIQNIVDDAYSLDIISEIISIHNQLSPDGSKQAETAIPETPQMSQPLQMPQMPKQAPEPVMPKPAKKKNSGGDDENRVSDLDVKDANYQGENTQITGEPANAQTEGAAQNNYQSDTDGRQNVETVKQYYDSEDLQFENLDEDLY